ncbi:hypothetical protein TNCT1_60570 [Streptomyces sp. 1-11]|nr:hypothetical protein TNCT1_60570 [Streptomyces sp. 1-11]
MFVNTPAAVAALYVAYRLNPPVATAAYNRPAPTPVNLPGPLDTEAQEPSPEARRPATHFRAGSVPESGNGSPGARVFKLGAAEAYEAYGKRTTRNRSPCTT